MQDDEVKPELCPGTGCRVSGGGAHAVVYCPRCDRYFEDVPRETWPKGTLYAGQPNSAVVPAHQAGKRR